ncbi:hypothetical protein DMC30DRAFT_302672 [Rhodotorula diobovata]|uniref:Proteophosphoglycan ppg4 n=1 Tax=Rhodotorula diobovata TaxID=5288 RepID=A0A5C5FRK6_9BASI|nr:hypothetical protein DMC30DRAFT_302672 [Rhodotorula diobovata]
MFGSSRQTSARPTDPASDPATRPAAGGLFTDAASPTGNTRTPRAARAAAAAAVAAGAATAPRLSTMSALTPAAPSTASNRARAAVTPKPNAGRAPASAQLVRTPGTVRAQTRLARGAAWRPSLTAGGSEAAQKLAERRELVRGPASAALEELLMVGRDQGGEDNGEWAVRDEAKTAVQAFQSLKTAYLSSQDFLDVSSLDKVVPHEVVDPKSPINTLVRLSNLTTFLNLVLTSAPDDSGVADRTAVANLKTAGDALLRHVKPEEDPVDDQLIKLIVDLKCQTYLLASSLSRTPVDTAPYFSQTLRQLLPTSRANALTDRGAAARFSILQSRALAQIVETDGDWAALRTKWRWEDLAREARDWVERCVEQSGLGVGEGAQAGDGLLVGSVGDADSSAEQQDEDEEDAVSATQGQDKGKARAVGEDDGADADGSEREGADQYDDASEGLKEDQVEVDSQDVVDELDEDESQKGSSVGSRREEGIRGALDVSASPSLSSSEDEVARNLVGSASPTAARSTIDEAQLEHQDLDIGAVAALSARHPPAVGETLPESQLTMRAESLLELGVRESRETVITETAVFQESLASVGEPSDRIDDFFDLLDETQPAEEEEAGAAAAAVQAEGSVSGLAQQSDESESVASQATLQPQQAAAGHLRFDGSNRLVRDPAPKPSRSRLLERQPDARKISFDDSQSQPASPAPRASTAARPVPSPEAGRSARDSLGSPEPAATGTGEHFSPVAGPSNARLQHVEMEPFLEQDFGGGFDDVEDDETLVREKNPLFRASTGADEADDATFQGFEDDDLPPPRQAFGSGRGKGTEDGAPKKRQDKSKDKGKGKAREESPPTPPATDILARLGAWKASQRPTRDAHDGDNGTDARRSSGKSKKRSAVRASGSKPARSSPSDESTGRGGSDSDDSVDIPIPARQRSKGKKRAAAASSESDDDDDDEPPRKQSQTKHKRRARSPSPPLPLGAPGNNYFQGRNQPGGRVPWSTTETDLLIELLRQIGCNWARMMKLHGPTGERSKTFRQRTNVSLKDKAVGLAVSYLRRGAPLPAYLRTVTIPKNKMPKVPQERLPANVTDEESGGEEEEEE